MAKLRDNLWREWELAYLKENYANLSNEELRINLFLLNNQHNFYPDRTKMSVRNMGNTLGLVKSEKILKQAREKIRNSAEFVNKRYDIQKKYKKEENLTLPQYIIDQATKRIN